MPAPFQFDKAVLQVVADDKQMIATLKRDEAVVNTSVNKMQGDLNRVTVTTQEAGEAAGAAASGVSILGAAAAVTGSQSLMASAQVGALAAAATTTARSALAAKTQLYAMVGAAKAFIVTPLGAAIVAITTVLAVLTWGWNRNRKAARQAREELDAINETMKAGEEATSKFATATERLEDKLAIAQGRMTKAAAAARSLRSALGEQLRGGVAFEAVERRFQIETDLAKTLERQAHAERKRLADLSREERIRKVLLGVEKQRLQVADERRAKADAEAAALSAIAGPQTREEARGLIAKQIQIADAQQRALYFLTKQLEQSRPGGRRHGIIEDLLSGLRGPETTRERMTFGAGAVNLAQFAASGRGMMPSAQRDPIEQTRIDRERKRTDYLERIAGNTDRTDKRLQTISFGAP